MYNSENKFDSIEEIRIVEVIYLGNKMEYMRCKYEGY